MVVAVREGRKVEKRATGGGGGVRVNPFMKGLSGNRGVTRKGGKRGSAVGKEVERAEGRLIVCKGEKGVSIHGYNQNNNPRKSEKKKSHRRGR